MTARKRKLKIPRSVCILGKKFKIKITTTDEITKTTGRESVGAINFFQKEILISSDIPYEDQVITYLHECHHAISSILGFSQVRTDEVFEIEAESYANGFYDVIKTMV